MDIISDVSKFSRIFLYRILYKNRVFAGVFSLIWGFFAIGNSITGLNDSFLNLILFPIGVLLIYRRSMENCFTQTINSII